MRNWSVMQWAIAIIIVAAVIAVIFVALPAMGIGIPGWATNIFWIILIAVVAIAAIGILIRLWNSWSGGP